MNKKFPRYGQEVAWRGWDGSYHRVEVMDHDTMDSAVQSAFILAIQAGWTPPRWWQWWRWGDTPAPKTHIRIMKTFREWADEEHL